MSIKDDFQPYIVGYILLAPNPLTPSPGSKGSDNGTMYTSEYFIMLKKNGLLGPADAADYVARIASCVDSNGLLNRVPIGQNDELDSPDDYYGVADGCIEMGETGIPRGFLRCLVKYLGCLNNVSPGTFSWQSFLARQPQMVCAIFSAAFPSLKNPLHYLVRLLGFPLYLISAIVLLVSCIGADPSDTDARRLAWHMGNATSKVSLMCWLAFKVWKNRLYKTYPNGMKDVAGIYYQPHPDNPYSKWWIT